jgi:hypothetical protein
LTIFVLQVQTFNSDVKLVATEKKALASIAKLCCKAPGMADDPTICETT